MPISINGAGTITGISVGGLNDSIITSSELANASVTAAKIGYAGAILQVVSTTKTDTYTMTSTTFTDVTGLSRAITPTSSSSKVLIIANIYICNTTGNNVAVKLLRDSTAISIGDASGSRTQATGFHVGSYDNDPDCVTVSYLDSPSTTSSVTYKWQIAIRNSGTACVNRGGGDADSDLSGRYASTITAIEVAA